MHTIVSKAESEAKTEQFGHSVYVKICKTPTQSTTNQKKMVCHLQKK